MSVKFKKFLQFALYWMTTLIIAKWVSDAIGVPTSWSKVVSELISSYVAVAMYILNFEE
jgi:hypothetical protein